MELTVHTEIRTTDPILRLSVYEAHDGMCFYTGQEVPFLQMAIDHIMPKKHGGPNCIANYVLTSARINGKKTDRFDALLVERMQYINHLVFAPKVVELYKTNHAATAIEQTGKVLLKEYIKKNFTHLSGQFSKINSVAKTHVPYVRIMMPGWRKNSLFFDANRLHEFLNGWPN
jgi:CRISPR/Cas system Type II protein with McrA/HNH and RuvC-like nuclease domain